MNETLPPPATEPAGTQVTRFNALKHGILSRYTVLPWENEDEYRTMIEALVAEHAPQGPTEEHLVEELAGILWRKRRLRMAEAAAYHHGLRDALPSYDHTVAAALVHLGQGETIEHVADAIQATPERTADELSDLAEDEAMTARALDTLSVGGPKAYDIALTALREDTRAWWARLLDPSELDDDEVPYKPDCADLRRFLEQKIVPWYATRRVELENRPLIRAQAYGEALDPEKLEGLARYEVHLDRKLERMLSMLLRLKELRQGPVK